MSRRTLTTAAWEGWDRQELNKMIGPSVAFVKSKFFSEFLARHNKSPQYSLSAVSHLSCLSPPPPLMQRPLLIVSNIIFS